MQYEINKLNPNDFELLSQSLTKKLLGNGAISFGEGPDGGRDATFQGTADYPSSIDRWSGYWVIQAKYRNVKTADESKDFKWLQQEIIKELNKYGSRSTPVKKPDNLIFFTNIELTPVAVKGGLDHINSFLQKAKRKYRIENIAVISYVDIVTLLNNHRDVAVGFSSFILPSDILNKMYELLNKADDHRRRSSELLGRFVEEEFKSNLVSKLEHAGKLTTEKVNLEKVFIDLYATPDGNIPKGKTLKFVASTILHGNQKLNPSLNRSARFVLIAGPGYGKSTLTQFLCQIYRSIFLRNVDNCASTVREVYDFLLQYEKVIQVPIKSVRLPFRITLKEYASWINDQIQSKTDFSVISYLRTLINRSSGDNYFKNSSIEEILKSISTLIVFDGLDEVPSSSNRQEVIEAINSFTDIILRRMDADAIIIATSRPQGYSKEFDNTSYHHLTITDLTPEDSLNYITKLVNNIEPDQTKRDDDIAILKRASQDAIVSRLMRSPLQASILTILVRSGGEPPRNKYDLFTEYYSTIFRREKQKNVANILNENPTYIHDIHNKLAFKLQVESESTNSPSATMTILEFENFIKSYLQNDVGLSEGDVSKVARLLIDASIARLVFIEEVQDGVIGFNIRSVQEYFAANYYIQSPDHQIHQKIFNISTPSYWNNTLMFCIGNIFRNKKYLIDVIESVFNELNGSDQKFQSASIPALYFHGSWTSIDTLNEAIFRGHPKYENKFSKNIKQVLAIPYIRKHLDVAKLPQNVKEEWLIKFIDRSIFNNEGMTFTGWAVLLLLLKSNFRIEEDKYRDAWLKLEKPQSFLTVLMQNQLFDSKFGHSLIVDILHHAEQFECHDFIIALDSRTVLSIVNQCNDQIVLSQLASSLFIKYFSDLGDDPRIVSEIFNQLFKKAGIAFNRRSINQYFEHEDSVIHFQISSDYTGRINAIFHPASENFTDMERFGLFFNVQFITMLAKFFLAPSVNSLIALLEAVEKVNSIQRHQVSILRHSNWLLWKIFQSETEIEQVKESLKAGKYGDVTDWMALEAAFREGPNEHLSTSSFVEYSFSRSWTSILPPSSIVEIFKLYENSHPREKFRKELIKAVFWFSFSGSFKVLKKEVHSSHKFQSLLLTAFTSSSDYIDEFWNNSGPSKVITLIALLPNNFILSNISQLNKLSKFSLSDNYSYSVHSSEREVETFTKIVSALQTLLQISSDPYILRLIPLILSNPHIPITYLTNIKISLNTDLKSVCDNDNRLSILCLLLLDINKSVTHLGLFNELFLSVEFTDSTLQMFLRIIERFNIQRNIEFVLSGIASSLLTNYETHSIYTSVAKSYFESQPSNLISK